MQENLAHTFEADTWALFPQEVTADAVEYFLAQLILAPPCGDGVDRRLLGCEGLQVLGFQVKSVQQVEERLKEARGLTYKGEEPLALDRNSFGGPYKTVSLKDPDGTQLLLSEEGWAV